ncbi:hypothetical protein OTU49_005224, partial [Cherax quadricarinatus]
SKDKVDLQGHLRGQGRPPGPPRRTRSTSRATSEDKVDLQGHLRGQGRPPGPPRRSSLHLAGRECAEEDEREHEMVCGRRAGSTVLVWAWVSWLTSVVMLLGQIRSEVTATGVQLSGDLMLGGLFPVHEKGDKTPCSSAVYDRGLQRLEAMLYAVDLINNDSNILPNITLGVHILDTCSKDTYALNQSLEFIRVSLDALDTSGLECSDGKAPRVKYRAKPVRGVVGGSYSSVSLQVANLFRLFHIPQVSPASTARALSDKD